ncbi:B12-binding domain-containing radical SAM protein [candidate division FCPU426 bacterium]|nr:B12-binding domain-containing radical SAM protein [candidate division FCPU426 bacterium]
MKILLISPSIQLDRKTAHGLMIPQLALHILQGLTNPEHQVKIVEEETDTVDLDEDCDLVGISCMTANAPRAYRLAREFRQRGKKVVLGGVHPTILPDEALLHADSVVVGEAEGVWEQLLEDQQAGRLQRKYHHPNLPLDRYIPLKYREETKKRLFNVIPIMSTRGCPYHCDFCCVSNLFGNKIRHVPVANVVRDIQESRGKAYIFLDDNIVGNTVYAKELFRAIKPLKIKWVGQSSISFVRDTTLMKMAAESGCVSLFFGLESVSEIQLKTMRKSIKELYKIEEAIKKVKDIGIHFHASMVFGFDGDTQAIFPQTLEFLAKNRIGTASLNILTPYPGTKTYDQYKREGRLLTADWRYYDHSTVVFKPKSMTSYELQTGTNWVKNEYSKLSSILHRLPGNLAHPLLFLAMNLAAKKGVKHDQARLPLLAGEIFSMEGKAPAYEFSPR